MAKSNKRKTNRPVNVKEANQYRDHMTAPAVISGGSRGEHTWAQLRATYGECHLVYKSRCKPPHVPMDFPVWYECMRSEYSRDAPHLHDTSMEEYVKRLYQKPTNIGPKHQIDHLPPKKLEDVISPPKPEPEPDPTPEELAKVAAKPTQNLVQWLPRDPVTGDERIRICVAGGEDREYLFIERSRMVILEYLDKMTPIRRTLVLDTKGVPVSCTCPDYVQRKHRCKHMRALTAALPKRFEPLGFE